MISVIDYGTGNLRSVENALRAVGAGHELIRDAESIARAKKIILPGVGHFGQMMREIDRLQVREALVDRIARGVPFLGVCLGMQALFETSEEAPGVHGLAIFKGAVRRFGAEVRAPHMGWNRLERERESKLLEGAGERPYVYFANSYYAPAGGAVTATCEYGVRFAAVMERDNVFAVQFHPEKSGAAGLKMLANFACW